MSIPVKITQSWNVSFPQTAALSFLFSKVSCTVGRTIFALLALYHWLNFCSPLEGLVQINERFKGIHIHKTLLWKGLGSLLYHISICFAELSSIYIVCKAVSTHPLDTYLHWKPDPTCGPSPEAFFVFWNARPNSPIIYPIVSAQADRCKVCFYMRCQIN